MFCIFRVYSQHGNQGKTFSSHEKIRAFEKNDSNQEKIREFYWPNIESAQSVIFFSCRVYALDEWLFSEEIPPYLSVAEMHDRKPLTLNTAIGLYRENAIAIQKASGDSNGGNV